MKMRKNIIAFILMNIVLITTNTISTIQYHEILIATLPEYPYPLIQTIITDSIEMFLFSFIICFGYPIYKHLRK